MEVKPVKWGSGLALRIPDSIVKDCGLFEDTPVDIAFSQGQIVIKPLRKRYVLFELLAEITSQNIHNEAGMGQPVGQELL
jgi:antitoxin MazE